jgi:hypothetical protein
MVFDYLNGTPDVVCIAIGCMRDADFPAPGTFYWASKKHKWLGFPASVPAMEERQNETGGSFEPAGLQ